MKRWEGRNEGYQKIPLLAPFTSSEFVTLFIFYVPSMFSLCFFLYFCLCNCDDQMSFISFLLLLSPIILSLFIITFFPFFFFFRFLSFLSFLFPAFFFVISFLFFCFCLLFLSFSFFLLLFFSFFVIFCFLSFLLLLFSFFVLSFRFYFLYFLFLFFFLFFLPFFFFRILFFCYYFFNYLIFFAVFVFFKTYPDIMRVWHVSHNNHMQHKFLVPEVHSPPDKIEFYFFQIEPNKIIVLENQK